MPNICALLRHLRTEKCVIRGEKVPSVYLAYPEQCRATAVQRTLTLVERMKGLAVHVRYSAPIDSDCAIVNAWGRFC